MLAWIKRLISKPELTEYVFPIIRPGEGHVRDHHVWAHSEREARLAVMDCYDIRSFIIGPAKR